MSWSTGRDRSRGDRPAVGVAVVHLDAVLSEHLHGHLDVGERGHRLADVAYVDAVVVAGAREQQRRDELRGRAGVDGHRAAGHGAGAVHREGQRATAAVVDPHARARPAPPASGRRGAAACGGRRRSATMPLARPATGGTNRITVPASPQSTSASRSQAAGVTAQSPSAVLDAGCRAADSAAAISRVSRERSGRRTTLGPSASAARTQRAVGQRLAAGQRHDAVHRLVGRGAGQRSRDGAGSLTRAPYRGQVSWARASFASRRASLATWRGLAAYVGGGPARAPGQAGLALGVDAASSSPPRTEVFLKNCRRCWRLGLRVGLVPEGVAGERGRHQRGGEHGRAQAGRAAGGQRGGGEDLRAGVDADERGGVGGDRGRSGAACWASGTTLSVTFLALAACASVLRRALMPPATKIEASIGRASNRVIVMRPCLHDARGGRAVRAVPFRRGSARQVLLPALGSGSAGVEARASTSAPLRGHHLEREGDRSAPETWHVARALANVHRGSVGAHHVGVGGLDDEDRRRAGGQAGDARARCRTSDGSRSTLPLSPTSTPAGGGSGGGRSRWSGSSVGVGVGFGVGSASGSASGSGRRVRVGRRRVGRASGRTSGVGSVGRRVGGRRRRGRSGVGSDVGVGRRRRCVGGRA